MTKHKVVAHEAELKGLLRQIKAIATKVNMHKLVVEFNKPKGQARIFNIKDNVHFFIDISEE